jgi:hypothetical protein
LKIESASFFKNGNGGSGPALSHRGEEPHKLHRFSEPRP